MQQSPTLEDELKRAHRALRLLSASNRTLLRASDETTLLHDVCRIAVEVGGYALSWIGYTEQDNEAGILPVAYYGNDDAFQKAVDRSKVIGEHHQCAITTAIQTGTMQLGQPLFASPSFKLPKEPPQRSCQSAIALPLRVDAEVIGALAIYAPEADSFNDDEVRLLDELASDLSFGIATIRLRKAHERANARNHHLAYYDALTNLPNRNYLSELLRDTLDEASKKGRQLALMLLDLNYLREINESYGHGTGDQILVQVAQKLGELVGEESIVARFGGDDFIILCEDAGQERLAELAKHLLAAIRQPFSVNNRIISIGGSIGIALYPHDAANPGDLLSRADLAMAKVKESGNGYCFYQSEMTEQLSRKLELAHRLESALSADLLQLFYQPKVELYAGQIVGAEALLRWNDPVLGWVSPEEFIAVAEERGLMTEIGEWVLRTACQHLTQWKQQGVKCYGRMAINVSPRQLEDPYYVERVVRVLEETGVSPACIELELTESCLMKDPERMFAILAELRWLGFSIALDDFGTGYSSLAYLKRFPIDTLKIDQAFVRNMLNDNNDRAIIATILAMAQQLGLQTVAEGVETEDQRHALLHLGCVIAQGYYFCRPQPAAEYTEMRLTRSSMLAEPFARAA